MAVANSLAAVEAGADPSSLHHKRIGRTRRKRFARGSGHGAAHALQGTKQTLTLVCSTAPHRMVATLTGITCAGQQSHRWRKRVRTRIRHPHARRNGKTVDV